MKILWKLNLKIFFMGKIHFTILNSSLVSVPQSVLLLRLLFSNLSTGSFDDSASEHSSAGTMNGTATSTMSNAFGFTPLLTAGSCSSTTTDSESEMSETSNTNHINSNNIDNNNTPVSNR